MDSHIDLLVEKHTCNENAAILAAIQAAYIIIKKVIKKYKVEIVPMPTGGAGIKMEKDNIVVKIGTNGNGIQYLGEIDGNIVYQGTYSPNWREGFNNIKQTVSSIFDKLSSVMPKKLEKPF